MIDPSIDLAATIDAMSTSIAMGVGADLPQDQIETAVALTLQAYVNSTLMAAGDLPDATQTNSARLTSTWEATSSVVGTVGTPAGTAATPTTATPSPTRTPRLLTTSTPTKSRTPTPSVVSTNTATYTLVPTSLPSLTPVPSATSPPTFTPTSTPDACVSISIGEFSAPSDIAQWTINNGLGSPITLTQIYLQWPGGNDALYNVILAGQAIWSGEVFPPQTTITSWMGPSSRREISGSADLVFLFGFTSSSSGYDLQVTFDNGCTVSDLN